MIRKMWSYFLLPIKIVILIFLLSIILTQGIYADYPYMDMQATPNPVGFGAQAIGMGGTFIGVDEFLVMK